MSVPVEARFGRAPAPAEGYTFEIRTSKLSGGYGESALRGSWRAGHLEVAGGLSSTDLPSLERAWAVDVMPRFYEAFAGPAERALGEAEQAGGGPAKRMPLNVEPTTIARP